MRLLLAVSAVVAVVVGLLIWSLLLIALKGGGGLFGPTRGLDLLALLAPMLFLLPAALSLFARGRVPTAAWLLALTPLAGVCNGLLGAATSDLLLKPMLRQDLRDDMGMLAVSLLWLPIALIRFRCGKLSE